MVDVLNAIPVRLFMDNGNTHTIPAYKVLMEVLVQKQTPYASAKKGDTISFTNDVDVRVTNPDSFSGLLIYF